MLIRPTTYRLRECRCYSSISYVKHRDFQSIFLWKLDQADFRLCCPLWSLFLPALWWQIWEYASLAPRHRIVLRVTSLASSMLMTFWREAWSLLRLAEAHKRNGSPICLYWQDFGVPYRWYLYSVRYLLRRRGHPRGVRTDTCLHADGIRNWILQPCKVVYRGYYCYI
jgi:hypothetical protein